jgi:hypothetical protein
MSRAEKFLKEKLSMEREGETRLSSTCSFGIDKTYRRISTSVPMESSGGKKKLSMETEKLSMERRGSMETISTQE